jgi:outer membrane protein, heavy metal efflux system
MRIQVFGLLLAFVAGCTLPRSNGPACCDHPGGGPTLNVTPPAPQGQVVPPAEPALQGAHPVGFYVQTALARNPEVQARERSVAAQFARVPQVSTLPDPRVSDTFYPFSGSAPQTAAGRWTNSLMVSQQYPWFGKLELRGQVAAREAQIALARLGEVTLRVVEDVRNAYYEVYFNQQALRITRDTESFLRQYLELAQTRYRLGQVSQQDVLRAQIELARVQERLYQYEQLLRQAQADLARALSTSPESDLLTLDVPALPAAPQETERLFQAALTARPELQGRLQAILRAQARVELARLDYCPDVTLGLLWNSITDSHSRARTANGQDNVGFSVGFNLPVRVARLDAGVEEARARVVESTRTYDSMRDEVFRIIRRLAVQARSLEQQIDIYRKTIVPRAEQTLRVSLGDYRSGKIDALQVIDNYNQDLRFRLQQVRLEAMLGQTFASLERAIGTQITKIGEKAPAAGMAPPPRKKQ